MDDKYRFLMDVGRMADATVELEGLRPVMHGTPGSMQATVRSLLILDNNGRRVNSGNQLVGCRLRWNTGNSFGVMEVRGHGSPIWERLAGVTRPLGRDPSANRGTALALVARELGVATSSFDEVAEAARAQAAEYARADPSAAVSWARKEPTVLYSPAWFEDPGTHECVAVQDRESAFREVSATIASLADKSRGETFYLREGSSVYMVGNLDEYLSERGEGLEELGSISILDDNGRLVIEWDEEGSTARQEVRIGEECDASRWRDDALVRLAWGKAREPRAADFLGVPQPNLEGLRREAEKAREREPGVKEIRAGDRVVSAFCADQRDLVSSDGQDEVEYGACDDDVLEGERREFMRRADDTDMDGIADGGEIDADHDGVPDIWEGGGAVAPDEGECPEL